MNPPVVIHFTGHGEENKENDPKENSKGDYLLLETINGSTTWFYRSDIQKILENADRVPELVYVSSCTSQQVGEIFIKAGVKHVICTKKGLEIADKAAIYFGKRFYWLIFAEGKPICKAFKIVIEEM